MLQNEIIHQSPAPDAAYQMEEQVALYTVCSDSPCLSVMGFIEQIKACNWMAIMGIAVLVVAFISVIMAFYLTIVSIIS